MCLLESSEAVSKWRNIFLMLLPGNIWSQCVVILFHFFQFLSLDDIKEAKNIDLKENEDDSKNEVG